jgi:outer membrane protein assembly factor BamB
MPTSDELIIDRRPARAVSRKAVSMLLAVLLTVLVGCAGSPPSAKPTIGTWLQPNYDYANSRDAVESTLSAKNVSKLGIAWTFPITGSSIYGSLSTTPIVVNGTVYLQDLQSNVYAIDLQSGNLKWEKMYNADSVGPNGVAVDQGKVFAATSMQTIAALNATTGVPLWSIRIPQPTLQGIDQQLTVYKGTLYVSTVPGTSVSNFYEGGEMGVIYALNEQTGAIKWSFDTVKDGNLWGNPQVNSGGGAWYPPAIDTSTGTTFWGTGNPGPYPGTAQYPSGSSRSGPDLYTDSELALSATGQLQWYQQVTPHDIFDHDFEASPILTTINRGAVATKIVIGSGKSGFVVAFEAQTGNILWKTAVGKHENDLVQNIPAGQSLTVLPGGYGGVETPMALADAVVYVPIVNDVDDFSGAQITGGVSPSDATGELDAIDVNTGKILWTSPLKSPDFGGATVAGDLVFTSTFAGQVVALNRPSGKQVWSWQSQAEINSPLTIVGDTVIVLAGAGNNPTLTALTVGATGVAGIL